MPGRVLFKEDFFERVVNINWGGGAVFVYGEWLGNVLHYAKVQSASKFDIRTSSLPESASRNLTSRGQDLFGITGGAYANTKADNPDDKKGAVFLVCGTGSHPHDVDDGIGNMTGVIDRHAVIYKSEDGLDWSTVHRDEKVISNFDHQETVQNCALVWDPKAKMFFYDQAHHSFDPHVSGSGFVRDQVYSSSDGGGWGLASETDTGANINYKSPFLQHTGHNSCVDGANQHVPDGVMMNADFKRGKPTFIGMPTDPPRVNYSQGSNFWTPGNSTIKIRRLTEEGEMEEISVSIPGVGCVTCVAGCNGIIAAGGFVSEDDIESAGAVAISADEGDTWETLDSTTNGVTTMIAAPTTAIRT